MSGLLEALERHSNKPNGDFLCIYGDPAYPLRRHLLAPYQHPNLTPEQIYFNQSMSSVRVAVEWVFGDITTYYKFFDFKRNLKIGLSAVGKMYSVAPSLEMLKHAFTVQQPAVILELNLLHYMNIFKFKLMNYTSNLTFSSYNSMTFSTYLHTQIQYTAPKCND